LIASSRILALSYTKFLYPKTSYAIYLLLGREEMKKRKKIIQEREGVWEGIYR